MRLGISVAVEAEARAILAEPAFDWKASGPLYRSAAWPLSLMLSGVGKAYAARAATLLLAESDAVCALGTAAGLGREPVGSLFLCPRAIEHDMDATGLGCERGVTPFAAMDGPRLGGLGARLHAAVRGALADMRIQATEGLIASGDSFLADAAKAEAIRTAFNANLADMESAAIAKIAMLEGKDFFTLRWVSDNADHGATEGWPAQVARSGAVFRDFLLALAPTLAAL